MNKVCQPTRNVCRYGYDYHCNDNKTGATCNATVGSKQGAPQVLPLPCVSTAFVAKAVPLPCGSQAGYCLELRQVPEPGGGSYVLLRHSLIASQIKERLDTL